MLDILIYFKFCYTTTIGPKYPTVGNSLDLSSDNLHTGMVQNLGSLNEMCFLILRVDIYHKALETGQNFQMVLFLIHFNIFYCSI